MPNYNQLQKVVEQPGFMGVYQRLLKSIIKEPEVYDRVVEAINTPVAQKTVEQMKLHNLRKVLGPAMATGVGVGALTNPSDSEAAMLPHIRRAYRAALAELKASGQEAKPLYHYSKDPKALVQGPRLPGPEALNEPWKPPAIYASDNLRDNPTSLLGLEGSPGIVKELIGKPGSGKTQGYVRIVPKPTATKEAITEMELVQRVGVGGDPVKYLKPTDITKLMDVDETPGLTEYLIRNPNAVRMFSDKGIWDPKAIAALTGGGALASSILNPDEAEAAMLPQIRQMYNQARKNAKQVLYHGSSSPESLVVGDIRFEDIIKNNEPWKPGGLYWTDRPKNIPAHLSGNWPSSPPRLSAFKQRFGKRSVLEPQGARTSPVVRGAVSSGAKELSIVESELRNAYDDFLEDFKKRHGVKYPNQDDVKAEWTKHLQKDYDLVKIQDADYQKGVNEYIQLNPDMVSMFYRDKARTPSRGLVESPTPAAGKYKSPVGSSTIEPESWGGIVSGLDEALNTKIKLGLGLGGALTGAVLGQPSEAEAMPLGKLQKETTAIKAIRSQSAYDRLIGTTLNLHKSAGAIERTPYEVVDVRKNPVNHWRYLVVKDAEGNRRQLPMTDDYLHALAGAKGVQMYTDRFEASGKKGKDYMSSSSLTKRQAQREEGPIQDDKEFKVFNESQAKKVTQIDPELLHDFNYVRDNEGRYLYMPREYSEHLATKGEVKIISKGPGTHEPAKVPRTYVKNPNRDVAVEDLKPNYAMYPGLADEPGGIRKGFSRVIDSLKSKLRGDE